MHKLNQILFQIQHLCSHPDGSDICDVPSTHDPNANVTIIVVNVRTDLVSSDHFSGLVDDTNGENYNKYYDFEEALDKNDTNDARDAISQHRTPSPTPYSQTPNPTNKPPSSQTYNYCDLGNTTIDLTYSISLGYTLINEECEYMNNSSRDLVAQIYHAIQIIIYHVMVNILIKQIMMIFLDQMISFCESKNDDDDTCTVPSSINFQSKEIKKKKKESGSSIHNIHHYY